MKRLLAILLICTTASAQAAQFVPGQVLTAAALNTAFATAQITAGTIDGAVIGGTIPAKATFTNLYSTTPDAAGYNATLMAYAATGIPNAAMAFKSARGTATAPAQTQTGDTLGNLDFFGYSTGPAYAASLDIVAAGPFSSTSWPTQLNFNATPSGSTVPKLAFTVSGNGVVTATNAFHSNGADSLGYTFAAANYGVTGAGAGIQLMGARGTASAALPTQANDNLGVIDFYGYGTTGVEGAAINATAGSNWGASNAETYLAFFTTPNGAVVNAERLRINGAGRILVGQTTDNGADLLQVQGSVTSSAQNTAGYNFTAQSWSLAGVPSAAMSYRSARGTAAAPTPLLANDVLGTIDAWGQNSTTTSVLAASINFSAASAFATNNAQTQINFNTTPSGSVAGPVNVMSVSNTVLTVNEAAKIAGAVTASGQVHGAIVVTANATVGASTLSAASLVGGVIMRSASTAAYIDTTDTATNIVAAIPNAQVGTSFTLRIVNTVAFAETIAAGTGVTLSGTTALAASTYRDFVGVITNVTAPAVTLYGTGSGPL